MMAQNRLFLIGLLLLFMGMQLRTVKTFELNEKVSQFLEAKFPSKPAQSTTTDYVDYDPLGDLLLEPVADGPKIRSVSPPKWLGWSLLSVGAILVLTFPCFRS